MIGAWTQRAGHKRVQMLPLVWYQTAVYANDNQQSEVWKGPSQYQRWRWGSISHALLAWHRKWKSSENSSTRPTFQNAPLPLGEHSKHFNGSVLFICCSRQISISYSCCRANLRTERPPHGTCLLLRLARNRRGNCSFWLQFVSCHFAASADVKSRRWPPISIQRRPPGTHSKLMRSDVAENWKRPLDDDPPEDTP